MGLSRASMAQQLTNFHFADSQYSPALSTNDCNFSSTTNHQKSNEPKIFMCKSIASWRCNMEGAVGRRLYFVLDVHQKSLYSKVQSHVLKAKGCELRCIKGAVPHMKTRTLSCALAAAQLIYQKSLAERQSGTLPQPIDCHLLRYHTHPALRFTMCGVS